VIVCLYVCEEEGEDGEQGDAMDEKEAPPSDEEDSMAKVCECVCVCVCVSVSE
jgi:hypothetical protein